MSDLEVVFQREKVLSMEAVRHVVGTESRMTAFRRLKALAYRSSYSHRGMYYTLDGIPEYDEYGVWEFDEVYFSSHGTLLRTVETLVDASATGYTALELEAMVHVRVQNAVKALVDRGVLIRQQIGHEYVYVLPGKSAVQLAARKRAVVPGHGRIPVVRWASDAEQVAEHLTTFLSVLDERQRRLYLGFESLKAGRGGDVMVASLAGVNVKTVARGRKDLKAKAITLERIRAAGAGRPPLKKTT
jgi:hypothetical protein